jgi:hypothetical protein
MMKKMPFLKTKVSEMKIFHRNSISSWLNFVTEYAEFTVNMSLKKLINLIKRLLSSVQNKPKKQICKCADYSEF